VSGGSFQERHFASLHVRRWEDILEAGVSIPELVATALLGLDALLANGFAAGVTRRRLVGASSITRSRFEFLIVLVIGIFIAPR
jgi:hypothetical protein